MEYGPATRTRSSGRNDQTVRDRSPLYTGDGESDESDIFKTPKVKKTNKGKARTPSGQVLSNSVEDIRTFFQKENEKGTTLPIFRVNSSQTIEKPNRKENNGNKISEPKPQQVTNFNSQTSTADVNPNNNTSETNCESYCYESDNTSMRQQNRTQSVNKPEQHKSSAESAKPTRDIPSIVTPKGDKRLGIMGKKGVGSTDVAEWKEKEAAHIKRIEALRQLTQTQTQPQEEQQEIVEMASGEDGSSQVMNVSLIFTMFQEIKNEMKTTAIHNGAERLKEVEDWQLESSQKVCEVLEEFAEYKTKNRVLNGVQVGHG